MEEDRHAVRSTVSRDGLTVMESYSPKFHDRTVENARWADFTVAFAVDFTFPGERLTATAAGEEYLPFDLPHSDLKQVFYFPFCFTTKRKTQERKDI